VLTRNPARYRLDQAPYRLDQAPYRLIKRRTG
jgi:hypothetical protein